MKIHSIHPLTSSEVLTVADVTDENSQTPHPVSTNCRHFLVIYSRRLIQKLTSGVQIHVSSQKEVLLVVCESRQATKRWINYSQDDDYDPVINTRRFLSVLIARC